MHRRSALLIAAIALTLGLSAPAAAAPERPARVRFRSADDARTRLDGYVFRPRGKGPFPAVIALHGCAGLFSTRDRARLSARHEDWARRLVDRGYVVFFPDSFTRRGIKNLCKRGGKRPLTPSHRAHDVRGAARWLAGRNYVDGRRLALLGWSHGGTTLLWAAREGAAPKRAEFQAAFAFYPACRIFTERKRWRPRIDLTILIGEDDDWTPAAPCRTLARRFPQRVKLVAFPGAHHGFDTPGQPVRQREGLGYSAGGRGRAHSGTHPKARRAAIELVEEGLQRALRTD